MLDYRDISLMESVPLMWGPVTASPVGIEPMTPPPNNWYPIHNGENSTFDPGWPPNTPYACAEARRTQVADATFRDFCVFLSELLFCPLIHKFSVEPFLYLHSFGIHIHSSFWAPIVQDKSKCQHGFRMATDGGSHQRFFKNQQRAQLNAEINACWWAFVA